MPDQRRHLLRTLAAAAALALAVSACSGSEGNEPSAAESQQTTAGSAVCGYLYEWVSAWKFALQPDPHAAYTYVVPQVTSEPIGFVVSGPFPYAAWTSWTIYDSQAQPFSLAKDSSIAPDEGSVNPFVVGTPVLSPERTFTLLILPKGTDAGTIAESLRSIPSSNVLSSPTSGDFYVLANRIYNAFPGYNRGGAAGPTNTPFPEVRAVNYETGDEVDCSTQNLLPSPKPPTEMPSDRSRPPSDGTVELTTGDTISLGSQGARRDGQGTADLGPEHAPELDPDRIEFTRPPLLPGGDVSSIPPPDNCAGYLGAATSTTEIGLIRMPHVAEWFDTSNLTATTPFEQEETTYVSFNQYGNVVQTYEPGSPNTGSLGNEELMVDSSGGATVVVWPRSLTSSQQRDVFAHAEQNGWALIRGDEGGPLTTPNLLIRLKGASESYPGGYTPTADRSGVPCYFDDNPNATKWNEVSGEKYVASAQNIGAGAPQGVNCSVDEFLGGDCLARLEDYIAETGGEY